MIYEIISFNVNRLKLSSKKKDLIVKIITEHNCNTPQIILFQELFSENDNEINEFAKLFGDTWEVGAYNNKNLILYDSEYLEKIEKNINDNKPYVEVHFKCKGNGFEFSVINTHLIPYEYLNSTRNDNKHLRELKELAEYCKSFVDKEKNLIIGGDFNYDLNNIMKVFDEKNWIVDLGYSPSDKTDKGLQTMCDSDSPWDHFIISKSIKHVENSFTHAIKFEKTIQRDYVIVGDTKYIWAKKDINDSYKAYTEISDHAPIKFKFKV